MDTPFTCSYMRKELVNLHHPIRDLQNIRCFNNIPKNMTENDSLKNYIFRPIHPITTEDQFEHLYIPDRLPISLHSLARDPRLEIFQLADYEVNNYDHDIVCHRSQPCNGFTSKPIYCVKLRTINRMDWGGGDLPLLIGISNVLNPVLSVCKPEEQTEVLLNFLRAPEMIKYNINHVIDDLTKPIKSKFYEFLTQSLIHINCDRSIVSNHFSESYNSRWSALTFLLLPGKNHNGIYFAYDKILDTFQENYKTTIFEPLLAYLSCLFNNCNHKKESFQVYIATQQTRGLFKNHNHTLVDGNWKFQFKRYQYISYDEVNRKDDVCTCSKCKNSTLHNFHDFLATPSLPM